MMLSFRKEDSIENLPSINRPMNQKYFAVTFDYGVPANGSITINEDGEMLIYSNGQWSKAETNADIKLQELFADDNGQYWPDDGYVGFDKVIVDVKPQKQMPVKGDLIEMDEKQYRVLDINDSIAKVVAMYEATAAAYGKSNVYAGSSVDGFCTLFYDSMPTTIQTAIVDSTIQQGQWVLGDYSGSSIATYAAISSFEEDPEYPLYHITDSFGEQIERKCYVISIADIIDYLEATPDMTTEDTTLTAPNIAMMLWNKGSTSLADDNYVWLSSAGEDAVYMCIGTMDTGISTEINGEMTYDVRPVFKIDLSKVDFTKD